jgi:hypothetical protein
LKTECTEYENDVLELKAENRKLRKQKDALMADLERLKGTAT